MSTPFETDTPDAAAPDAGCEVLFVDLDGTLIQTDLFYESLGGAVRAVPSLARRLPAVVLGGRAVLKRLVAACAPIRPGELPYRQDVLDFVRAQRAAGRRIVLATASDEAWARSVADHLGLFDDVLASDGRINLKGAAKLAAIEQYCREHGYASFGYVGDSHADLPIWKTAEQCFVVAPSRRLLARVRAHREPNSVLGASNVRLSTVVQLLRPEQWVKNVLLFLPLVLAHRLGDVAAWLNLAVAFAAFSLCASGTYIINDLIDLPHDRAHPRKRLRPLAAGTFPVGLALPLAAGLIALGIVASAIALSPEFLAALVCYLVMTLQYSTWLKRRPLVDVIVLAGLYTLRIVAGGLAADVYVSEWLWSLSVFLFASLAFAKRCSELIRVQDEGASQAGGRGYMVVDIGLLETLGPASGYLAVLVLALYIQSEGVATLYPHRRVLWLVCPLLMYWVSRVWLWTRRGILREDPLVFALTDRISLAVAGITALVAAAAAIPW